MVNQMYKIEDHLGIPSYRSDGKKVVKLSQSDQIDQILGPLPLKSHDDVKQLGAKLEPPAIAAKWVIFSFLSHCA
jgi:hypothetical protein